MKLLWGFSINNQQSTINSQQSTVNNQQSTINSQQSTVNSQQSTVNSQQSTVNSQQSTVNSQQSTVNNPRGTRISINIYHNKKNSSKERINPIISQQSTIINQRGFSINNQQSSIINPKVNNQSDSGFQALQKRVFKERGLDLGQYREKCLKRRIDVRLRATGAHSYLDYMTLLKRDPSEYDRLFDVLTINVTNFFRDKSTYRVVKETVIPELVSSKKKQDKKMIRVWSAGCASGEEPYSMAILFHKILGDKINDFLISIHATDIDEVSLDKAKSGEYEAGAVSEVDEKILKRYFNRNLKYSLKEEIKQMVRFKRHDLISDRPLAHLDIILCRNVLIYFSRGLQIKLFDKFCEGLNRGGYLILGKTESLAGGSTGLFQPVSIRERIYRKI